MQFVQVDLEFADHMGRQRQDQRGDVASEQAIEAPSHAVVIERRQLVFGKPECLGSIPCGPFANAVERLAAEEHIFEQEQRYQPRERSGSVGPRVGGTSGETRRAASVGVVRLTMGKAPSRYELRTVPWSERSHRGVGE